MQFPKTLTIKNIKKLYSDSCSSIKKRSSNFTLLLHPLNAKNIKVGVRNELNSMLNVYISEFKGILVGYENVKIVSPMSWLFDTNPYLHLTIMADFYIFSPEINNILKGTVVKKSKNVVGCLIHHIFNASSTIPPKVARNEWCGTHVNEGDVLHIEITKLDLTSPVPYISGDIVPESSILKPSTEAFVGKPHIKLAEEDIGNASIDKMYKKKEAFSPTKKKIKIKQLSFDEDRACMGRGGINGGIPSFVEEDKRKRIKGSQVSIKLESDNEVDDSRRIQKFKDFSPKKSYEVANKGKTKNGPSSPKVSTPSSQSECNKEEKELPVNKKKRNASLKSLCSASNTGTRVSSRSESDSNEDDDIFGSILVNGYSQKKLPEEVKKKKKPEKVLYSTSKQGFTISSQSESDSEEENVYEKKRASYLLQKKSHGKLEKCNASPKSLCSTSNLGSRVSKQSESDSEEENIYEKKRASYLLQKKSHGKLEKCNASPKSLCSTSNLGSRVSKQSESDSEEENIYEKKRASYLLQKKSHGKLEKCNASPKSLCSTSNLGSRVSKQSESDSEEENVYEKKRASYLLQKKSHGKLEKCNASPKSLCSTSNLGSRVSKQSESDIEEENVYETKRASYLLQKKSHGKLEKCNASPKSLCSTSNLGSRVSKQSESDSEEENVYEKKRASYLLQKKSHGKLEKCNASPKSLCSTSNLGSIVSKQSESDSEEEYVYEKKRASYLLQKKSHGKLEKCNASPKSLCSTSNLGSRVSKQSESDSEEENVYETKGASYLLQKKSHGKLEKCNASPKSLCSTSNLGSRVSKQSESDSEEENVYETKRASYLLQKKSHGKLEKCNASPKSLCSTSNLGSRVSKQSESDSEEENVYETKRASYLLQKKSHGKLEKCNASPKSLCSTSNLGSRLSKQSESDSEEEYVYETKRTSYLLQKKSHGKLEKCNASPKSLCSTSNLGSRVSKQSESDSEEENIYEKKRASYLLQKKSHGKLEKCNASPKSLCSTSNLGSRVSKQSESDSEEENVYEKKRASYLLQKKSHGKLEKCNASPKSLCSTSNLGSRVSKQSESGSKEDIVDFGTILGNWVVPKTNKDEKTKKRNLEHEPSFTTLSPSSKRRKLI